jgi:hypothetical protein
MILQSSRERRSKWRKIKCKSRGKLLIMKMRPNKENIHVLLGVEITSKLVRLLEAI